MVIDITGTSCEIGEDRDSFVLFFKLFVLCVGKCFSWPVRQADHGRASDSRYEESCRHLSVNAGQEGIL